MIMNYIFKISTCQTEKFQDIFAYTWTTKIKNFKYNFYIEFTAIFNKHNFYTELMPILNTWNLYIEFCQVLKLSFYPTRININCPWDLIHYMIMNVHKIIATLIVKCDSYNFHLFFVWIPAATG